jgi:hypothetical protein
MKLPTKEQQRSIITILILSDGKNIRTQDLLSSYNYDKWIWSRIKHIFPISNERISDQILSRVLSNLESKNIIQRVSCERKGKGAIPNCCSLINDQRTLFEIFKFIRQSKLEEWIQLEVKYEFFKTSFFQNLINEKLLIILNNIPSEVDWLDPDLDKFTDENLELILNIIKISPSALEFVLAVIFDEENRKFFLISPLAKLVIKGVIFNFLNDLKGRLLENYPIDYKIEISLAEKPAESGYFVKKSSNSDYSDGNIKYEVVSSIDTLRDDKGCNKKVSWEAREVY